jgi:hypothetical protein
MITFVNSDESVAVPVMINDASTVFALYGSWADFLNSVEPVATHVFNGVNNYIAAEQFFSGWTKVCRDDTDWSVVECGPLPTPVVPASVSARQIRLWLISNGVSLAQIDALIDNLPDQMQREYTRVEWDYAPYVERSHPMIATFAAALWLTEEQVDAGFITAATL